ncbi:MAG TPA: hypothetical protein VJM49_06750 [Acidimicrobiales bacterium]|nr:hypothetical protein [Acidimicrobiales bacterium]
MPDAVQVVGAAEAFRDIDRWADQLGPAVTSRSDAFGATLAGRVRGEVPVLTGTLAASVETVALDEAGVGVAIGDGVPYAGWIEFGGSRGREYIAEGRYLYPTALEAEDEFVTLASDTADDTARSFPWSTPST